MGGVLEHFDEFAERNVLLHSHDIGAWYHKIVETPFTQAEDALEHPAFVRGKTRFGGGAVKQDLEVRPNRSGTPAEHCPHHAIDPRFAVFASEPIRPPRQSRKITLLGGGSR